MIEHASQLGPISFSTTNLLFENPNASLFNSLRMLMLKTLAPC